MQTNTFKLFRLTATGVCLFALNAHAQFDPAKVKLQPPPVEARFPPPTAIYDTPAFDAPQTGFTSYEQMMARLQVLGARPNVRLETVGTSEQGRSLPLILLAHGARFDAAKPTLMLVAQQHGNEPAPGEAILVLLERWSAPERAQLLRQVNIVALPRANPDGAALFKRANAHDVDLNRDHLLLRTPEARALAKTAARFRPQVVLDMHEFTAGDRWVTRFDGWAKYDVLLQAATTGNLDSGVYQGGIDDFLPAIRRAVAAEGLSESWYHTTASDPKSPVAMGGVQPDTWRNIGGLRNAVSILHETRGVGIGKQNLARRVHAHVVAAEALVQRVASRGPALVELARRADREVAARACQGDIVVAAQQTPERRELTVVDAKTGADRAEVVDWRSSLTLKVAQTRARPCGYWLAPTELRAVQTLQALGVQVKPLASQRPLAVERYAFESIEASQRQDGRGAIQDQDGILKVRVTLQAMRQRLPDGGWYVSLAQPLAGLVSAALEPDSQNSYVAARLIAVPKPGEGDRLVRVMQRL
jgi:hypothetical protein